MGNGRGKLHRSPYFFDGISRLGTPARERTWSNRTMMEKLHRLLNGQRSLQTCVALGIAQFVIALGGMGAEVSYRRQILPIFAESCLQCHGPDEKKLEGDLRLDLEKSSKNTAIVAGEPDASALIHRIYANDPEEQMPPSSSGKVLSDSQKALLKQWIAEGAKYEGHWSFEPIRNPPIPMTHGEATTSIDRFIVHASEIAGLQRAPHLNRHQWIRRATFDLIGLPPTWDEVTSFVEDASPLAKERVIDRLLGSPQYGERWGRHWLDLARYADTHGGSAIGFTKFPFSYTYRDYVVNAFNEDRPYNRLILEQLAADQLDLPANDAAHAALGFLTVGMQFRSLHDVIDDQIDVVSRGLQGLTVACARCHDHKYDPISTRDYYSLYATFASSRAPSTLPILGNPIQDQEHQAYRKELSEKQAIYDDMARDQSEIMRNRLRVQVGMYLAELAKGTPEQDLSAAFLSYRTDDIRPLVLNRWRDYLNAMSHEDPVFRPWMELRNCPADQFSEKCLQLVETLSKENGDPTKYAKLHNLATAAPRWNPRIVEAIQKRNPQNLLELATIYGEIFTEVHRQWLLGLQETALASRPGETILTDEDPKHEVLNSAIDRQWRRHLYAVESPTAVPDELAVKMLNRTVSDQLNGKKGAIHNLHLSSPGSPPRAMALIESDPPPKFTIFRRGNPLDRGDEVEARFLTILSRPHSKTFEDGKRRLGLAQSLIAEDNPLTRRVLVNWVWQNHFGQGLVRTPDDFGTRGRPPSHPELLDHLATVFSVDGWSIKALHRRIMLSDLYQLSAIEIPESRNRDPENDWFWRFPRRRLEMEAMRDAMLFVSGELDPSMGGRPIEWNTEKSMPRRSLYGFINRDIISPLFSTFDGANPNACTVKRPDTFVPQQTLFALNSEFIQDRAARVASLARKEAEAGENRIRWLYRRLLTRDPDRKEIELATKYLAASRSIGIEPNEAQNTDREWDYLAHAIIASNEFVFID